MSRGGGGYTNLHISIQIAFLDEKKTEERKGERRRRRRRRRRYLDFAIPTWDARCRGAGFGVVDWLVCLCVCLCGGGGGGGLLFVHGVSYVYRYICVYPLGFV